MSPVFYSSISSHWATPKALYAELQSEFRFDFDPCPLRAKDNLPLSSWIGKRVFCNPPYNRGILKFLDKALEAEVAVFLLPARTDTKWFHEIVLPNAQEIRFIKGRLHFNDGPGRAPFPSMLVIFKARQGIRAAA